MQSNAPSTEDFCRSYLLCYATSQFPGYQIAKHHQLIASHLEALERRQITKLLMTVPPRHGKTMLASEFFPAFYLGRNPSHEIISATYSKDRAMDTGLKVKNQLESDNYQAVFSTRLNKGSKSKSQLVTTEGGALYSVGVGGAITGRGANLFLMDDLVKSREEAESETSRNRLLEWFKGTAFTRLMPGGVLCLIMCIAEGERVLMGSGVWKNVEDVKAGDIVVSHEDGATVRKKVLKASCCGEDDIVRVTSRSYSLRVNKRHPFLAEDGRWVPAGELNPGDKVVIAAEIGFRVEDIESIDPDGKANVYDLTVEGAENFIAEGFVVHNTRWHTQDLAGVILEEWGDDWTHLDLPAICDTDSDMLGREQGEALWPEFYNVKDLNDIKEVIGSREFNAQYQQRPIGVEGSIIRLEWFKRYHKPPPRSKLRRIIQSWDTAYESYAKADPSVCTVWGQFIDRSVDGKERIYLLDVWRERAEYVEVKKMISRMYQKWPGTSKILIEDKTSGKSIIKDLQQTNLPIIPIKDSSSKEARMIACSGLIEAGKVYLPEKAPWLYTYETEIAQFPVGRNDDQVDSTSQALNYIKKPFFARSFRPQFWK